MQILNSCHEAIEHCLNQKYFACGHLYSDDKTMDIHIHDCCEIYYSISGGRQYLIDNRFYSISPGDLFFINPYESHCLTKIDTEIHERIVLSIHPDYLKSLCTPSTDLEACFRERGKGFSHRVSLSAEDQNRFLYYIRRITGSEGYGSDLLEQAAFLEMMVFLNKRFQNHQEEPEAEKGSRPQVVDQILSYLHQHIRDPFSLDDLAAHFFLSSSYLCRIFKSSTGTTIHKYVTAKRITLAKSLLNQGYPVMEACAQSGFGDYSNFFKAFTKATGLSPKKYSQLNA